MTGKLNLKYSIRILSTFPKDLLINFKQGGESGLENEVELKKLKKDIKDIYSNSS